MKPGRWSVILSFLVLTLGAWPAPAQEEPEAEEETSGEEADLYKATPLPLDARMSSVIAWDEQHWQSFTVEVPEDAMVLTLAVEDSAVDLDLYARSGAPISDYNEDAEHEATSRLYNDTLRISRSSDPSLKPGTYYVNVTYALDAEPRIGKRRATELPFSIKASVIRSRVDGELKPGKAIASQTDEAGGWFRSFTVNVPKGSKALRLDLDEASGDLDIVARRGRPIFETEPGDLVADTILGRETLVIDQASDPPIAPGLWFINVYDPFELDVVHFRAHVRFEDAPPAELLAIPALPAGKEGIERALLAVVEVITSNGSGSGTLISPDGWVLTNRHVVEDDTGGVAGKGELVVSLNLDPKVPPAELYRASVVLEDEEDFDLALVKIESGLYGQPLPAGHRFPHLDLGTSGGLKIGDPLTLLGFPGVGGLGSRATISLTRGVVAGFDTTDSGLRIKTDAELGSGNSGGAAVDGEYRLIAVPSGTVEDSEGYSQLGYLIPIDLLPEAWRAKVGGRP